MKLVLMLLLGCLGMGAQNLSFYIHDPSGKTPDVPLPATYAFPATAQGSASSVELRAQNTGSVPVELILVYVGNAAESSALTQNYSITGQAEDNVLAPGSSEYFNLNFVPRLTGTLSGYLQAAYLVPQNGCTLAAGNCPTTASAISTLTGESTAPQLVLSYNSANGPTVLQPNIPQRLDFGNVSVSTSTTLTFTLANQSQSAVTTPSIALQNLVFGSSAFALSALNVPSSIPAGGTGTFTVTFAPGQTGFASTTLTVGSNLYGLQGTGIAVTDIDELQVTYVDSTGVRSSPQAATPISFGQIVPGAGNSSTLTFTVTNPSTSFSAVSLPSLQVTGSAFTLSGAPTIPASIAPGASITFTVTFKASVSGTSSGTLVLGTRSFTLTGLAVVSPVPSISLVLSNPVLSSQQQVSLQVQFSAAASSTQYGQLAMQFKPAVSGISDDPAVFFLATSGRQLQISVAAGAQTATYDNMAAIVFQTGTTAGTLTFTVTFPNAAPYSQSFTITPAQISIASASALRQSPNLVITVNGFDNTYSAGKMNFVFYDLKGNAINPDGMAVDATTDFRQYFFGSSNQAGGAFAVQASFPVNGDSTQVGSVAVSLSNSAGTVTNKLSFQ